MKRKLLFLALLSLALLANGRLHADDDTEATETDTASSDVASDNQSPQLELIDVPTADILDPMTFSTMFRFYSEGGMVGRFLLGPIKMVNLGISFDAQRVIGGGDPHMITPSVFFKVKPYDGSDYLPAIALGYDNQGMLWKEDTKDFLNPAKDL